MRGSPILCYIVNKPGNALRSDTYTDLESAHGIEQRETFGQDDILRTHILSKWRHVRLRLS